MTRQCLPNRRLAETFELEVAGLRYTCTVGRFNDGRLAEVFLSNDKSNSAADTSARDSAIVFSIAVQCSVNPEVFRRALSRNSQGHASSPLGTALDLIAVAEVAGVGLPRGATTSRRIGPEGDPKPVPGPYR
jgi:hypothetical protein